MRRLLVSAVAVIAALVIPGPAAAAASSSVAALQVALRAHGHYAASVDGVDGPLTRTGLTGFQARTGLPPTGRVGTKTRRALGALGRPLLGQRELGIGAVGWDVSSLEFKLIPFGLSPKAVDGRFTAATAKALARFQAAARSPADGIAGKQTYRGARRRRPGGLVHSPVRAHATRSGGRRLLLDRRRLGVSPLCSQSRTGWS